jgi:hypothetical protein
MVFAFLVVVNRFFPRFSVLGYWVGANPGVTTILCFLAIIVSILFVCIGILGEYLVVLLQEVKRRPTAVVEAALGDLHKHEDAGQVIDLTMVNRAELVTRASGSHPYGQ